MPPIIRVEKLGKRYTLGRQADGGAGYRRFSEDLLEALKRPFRRKSREQGAGSKEQGAHQPEASTRNGSPLLPGEGQAVRADANSAEHGARSTQPGFPAPCSPPPASDFWALRDVSFDVHEGEVLGIIGRNGAGKSTLLKILSRITEPSEGRVTLRGRVASLLEVGTGFHPELTGRENVYLNGAVLGMSRAEIKKKFDQIVAFAEVEKFLDTPVKRYSSGMYVRLAFAVAAHLEPEILIVDEVLAVGDAEFQKKCLGKMKDVAGHGRTVLFVSHNMDAIKQLCEKAILLNNGAVGYAGTQLDVVKEYQTRLGCNSAPVVTGSQEIVLAGLRIKNHAGEEIHTFNTFDKVTFELTYKSEARLRCASFALCFDDISGTRATSLWSSFQNKYFDIENREFKCVFEIASIHLNPGVYSIVLYAESNSRVLERIDNYMYITVGYIEKHGLVKLPERIHGGYAEAFEISIR